MIGPLKVNGVLPVNVTLLFKTTGLVITMALGKLVPPGKPPLRASTPPVALNALALAIKTLPALRYVPPV